MSPNGKTRFRVKFQQSRTSVPHSSHGPCYSGTGRQYKSVMRALERHWEISHQPIVSTGWDRCQSTIERNTSHQLPVLTALLIQGVGCCPCFQPRERHNAIPWPNPILSAYYDLSKTTMAKYVSFMRSVCTRSRTLKLLKGVSNIYEMSPRWEFPR